MSVLGPDEKGPVELLRLEGAGRFVLTADHAGRAIPRGLADLGVSASELERHIAWDIGIAGVTRRLSALLDVPAVLQVYSRLVIDCNRPEHAAGAFLEVSEATAIPGNKGLDEAAKAARRAAIFAPYHAAIADVVSARVKPVYVAMHSFTPVYLGQARPMHVAVLYNRAPRFSRALAALLREEAGLVVAENEPYRVTDETDYGVPVHAERRGLDYVEIEIRQDLIQDEAGQEAWAARLARLLPLAADRLGDV
jgi:predicted N-formylglutamate amidohydrolase